MATARQLTAFKRLQEFFDSEIQSEVRSGFARLGRIPESHVVEKLRYYGLLGERDKRAFLDFCPYGASAYYSFVIKLPRMSLQDQPFFTKLPQVPSCDGDCD